MERLTEKRNDKNVIPLRNAICGVNMPHWEISKANDLEKFLSGDAADRLAAYEETDLPPEICREYKTFEDEIVSKGVTIKRIVELMNAEAEGRLVELPCKVGDTVWDKNAEPLNVISVEWFSRKVIHLHCVSPVTKIRHTFSVGKRSLGKTVFLTREEAEAALRGADT